MADSDSKTGPARGAFSVVFVLVLALFLSISSWGIIHLSEAFLPETFLYLPLYIWLGLHAGLVILVLYAFQSFRKLRRHEDIRIFFRIFGIMVLTMVPELIFDATVILHAVTDGIAGFFTTSNWPVWILVVGAGLAITAFFAILHGILVGRWKFTLREHQLPFKELPNAWKDLRVVQISDLHIGSFFDRYHKLEPAIEKINALKPDVIVFTGDLVNNHATEAEGWAPLLSKLEAPLGKYSILGNHDYGDYVSWDSAEAKMANLERLKEIHAEAGFQLLNNSHVTLERDGESIQLIGVENWGLPPFPQYGSLEKALEGADADKFSILLSHDPSHWEAEVTRSTKIHLTLSGHTHGMQFGLETKTLKWSPVKWRYPKWAGLYSEGNQMLYVNRGLGFLGFPGRVGIWPEITLLRLQPA